ncbi:MAG: alpha/beta fold hydrolase [Pseudomonadota bacterium]
MALAKVDVTRTLAMPADHAWRILRAFCEPWHPMVAGMRAEQGGTVRAFTTSGDPTLYRERLTWLSDSDRALRYTHLEGIAGAARYEARLSVSGTGASCEVRWQAEIEAEPARAREIASGTETIFQAGLDALPDARVPQTGAPPQPSPRGQLSESTISAPVRLSLLSTPRILGPLCLFLHGIGGQKENWAGQLAVLGTQATCVALDLRGYGGSAPGPAQSTLRDYFADILAVKQAFGDPPLILCGLSYGAWIATDFALQHPGSLQALVLAGGCTGMSEASEAERRAFLQSREVPLAEGMTPADFAPAVVDVIAGPNASEDLRRTLTASMAAIPARSYRDALRCFTSPPGRFDFRKLQVPVLMMTGAHDRLAPPEEIRSVANRIWQDAPTPDVRFEEISGAGHVCNLENPQQVNRVLGEFLNRWTQ